MCPLTKSRLGAIGVFSKLRLLGLDHSREPTTENNLKSQSGKKIDNLTPRKNIYLSCPRILHLKCDLRRPIWRLLHLPNTCLEPVARHDGRGKTHTKISQRKGHASIDSLEDCSSGKSER